jgi:hypothetical protein
MPGQELRLGPFLGGLNLFSDPSSVADTEMVSCVNFEVGLDGSLVSRPPITQFQATAPSATSNMKILLLAVFTSNTYLIGSNGQGIYQSSGGAWTLISSAVQSETAVQYNNKVWFFPKIGTTTGGTWDGTTFTNLAAALPPASVALIYKERAWIVPGTAATSNTARLQYSLTGDPGSWNTGDATFIDIQPGDGQKLVDLVVYQDNILLFKQDSTFALAFDSIPSSATLKKINPTIGVSGSYSVVSFENSVFVFHRDAVYEIVNYHWTKINIKVPPAYDNTLPSSPSGATFSFTHFLTIWGDRLVFRYYKKLYSFGIRTRTWTEFQVSQVNNEHWFGPLVRWPSVGNNVLDVYYGGSCIANDVRTYKMQNGYDSSTTESANITCTMQTKNFDSAYGRRYRIFSFGQRFKKMHWWGATVYTSQSVTGTVTPIVSNFAITWATAKAYTWAQLNTWAQPLPTIPGIVQTWASPGTLSSHFVKFPKSLRYRQVNFQIQMQTNGNLTTGPAKLFGIVNVMEVKQVVTEGSS